MRNLVDTDPRHSRRHGGTPLGRHALTCRTGALAAALVLATVLTACGTSSDSSTHTGNGTTQVTIGKAVDTVGFTTVDVAKGKGYFAKEGVNANEELMGGSSTAFAALQSGSIQFVTASTTALINARAKGVPLEAVASMDYGVSLQLIASTHEIKAHHLSTHQPLNTVMRALTGATLGVISTTDLTYNHFLMQQAGVNPDQFKFITLKTQSAALAALQHGQIDAFLLSPPNSYLAQSQGGAQIIATLHSVPILAKMDYDILVVDSNWAKANSATVKSVATSIAMADNVMSKNPNSVLSLEKKHYSAMSNEVLLHSLQYVSFAKNGKMTKEGWQDAKKEAAQTGVKEASSVDVSPDGGTWTNDFIKQGDL